MKVYIGITDSKWYENLSKRTDLEEVNFWQPGGQNEFQALNIGELFLFKLHSPLNYIVGGGFFTHFTRLPVSLAWEAFGINNGASTFIEMNRLIQQYRKITEADKGDYKIGCIILNQPFFLKRDAWIPVPADWSPNIVQGKTYDIETEAGKKLWEEVQLKLKNSTIVEPVLEVAEERARYGEPILVKPRLGQGGFRVLVIDTYNRRCAVTLERTLPALDAAHIKPFNVSGPHELQNGILLRSDIHHLLDTGYVTISNDLHFEVSKKIKEEFENGRDYYAMHGRKLTLPVEKTYWPEKEYIEWHQENVFRG